MNWWALQSARGAAAAVVAGVGTVCGVGVYGAFAINRPRQRSYVDGFTLDPEVLRMPFKSISFSTEDDVELNGWWIPQTRDGRLSDSAVVFCHPYNSNKSNMLALAGEVWASGHSVLLFDFRSFANRPTRQTIGHLEVRDARAAVRHLRSHLLVPEDATATASASAPRELGGGGGGGGGGGAGDTEGAEGTEGKLGNPVGGDVVGGRGTSMGGVDGAGGIDGIATPRWGKVGVLGASMGGAVALQIAFGPDNDDTADSGGDDAARRSLGVDAVVSDCAFAALEDVVANTTRNRSGMPPPVLGATMAVLSRFNSFWFGYDLDEVRPVDTVRGARKKRTGDTPLLLIHSEKDSLIPVSHGHRLHEAAATGRKELWVVPDAEHIGGFFENKRAYSKKVCRFFDTHLGQQR